VPGVGSEWFWWSLKGQQKPSYMQFMRENYKARDTYAGFAEELTGTFYNPGKWADLFRHAGAKYVVISAKHHDGFCMWPSPYSHHWNSLTSGPARDVVGDFFVGMKEKPGLNVGVFYSLYEWFNPIYSMDKNTGFKHAFYPATKAIPELKDLVERYTPDLIWASGDWEAPHTYWNSTLFLAWLYNNSPVKDKVVVNDRWGDGTSCKHGGYLTCVDRFNPRVLQTRKWENVITMDRLSWGHRRNAHAWDFLETRELVRTLAETISCGGNLLINIGITADGMINPIYEDRLMDFGNWIKINGEAVYGTTPWRFQNDTVTPDIWYTSKKDGGPGSPTSVYALVLVYPLGGTIELFSPITTPNTEVFLLGHDKLGWKPSAGPSGIVINMPPLQALNGPPIGWVLRMTNLANA